jgi:polar amino acid transport system substrate-binding protein
MRVSVSPAIPPAMPGRRSFLAVSLALVAAGCASRRKDPLAETRRLLAPTGALRVGLVRGSPLSIVGDPISPNATGVGLELGRAMAYRLDVPVTVVLFGRAAEVRDALRDGRVDVAFISFTPERDKGLRFTSPYLHLELGYLVPAGSNVKGIADIDRAAMRVGVGAGSTSEAYLAEAFRQARVVPAPTTGAAVAMLAGGQLDAFATDKAVLHRMSASLPGSRVLDGRWGVERFAAALAADRAAAMPFVERFVADAEREGLVERAVESAGVRGVLPATAR